MRWLRLNHLLPVAVLAIVTTRLVLGTSDFLSESGVYTSISVDFGTFDVPDSRFSPYQVRVYMPSQCNITAGVARAIEGCPVMVFTAALPGFISLKRYDRLFEHTATHGLIVVATATDQQSVKFGEFAKKLESVLSYVFAGTNGLQDTMAENNVVGKPRLDKVIFGGHGQGARIMLHRATQQECERGTLGGMVMYSPVEDYQVNVDFGQGTIIPDHPNDNVPWVMPAIMLMTELDNEFASSNTPPCAPDDSSNFRFFNKWRGPIWQTSATTFGFLDLTHSTAGYFVEDSCANGENNADPSQDGTNRAKYRQVVAASTLHFVNNILYQDVASKAFLTPTRPQDVKRDINGLEIYLQRTANLESGEDAFAGCTFDPDRFPWVTRLVMMIVGGFCGLVIFAGAFIWFKYVRKQGENLNEYDLEKLAMEHTSIIPGFGAVKEGGAVPFPQAAAVGNPMQTGNDPSVLDRLDDDNPFDEGIRSNVPSRIPSNYGEGHESTDMIPFSLTMNLSNGGARPPTGRESTDMVPFSVTTNFSTGETGGGDERPESSFPDKAKGEGNGKDNEDEDIF
mmetsp:Transcript_1489/g.1991  ORF Transcript_1489/g.1991 Transcript_1489/m.1991 type:complete len:566 (+) Transcript_1489:157-1854(+)|eukprot:CAMPEP_0204874164 /NCGR_PEP_ID=MMETSP1348-20121228/42619_1 /ASSEMBLY_ACC=CAM_ASM_000700 /TAXON_ID=215587 /ORGANISM="Aplanochytrium stocchinoi, Strain GSBS06" /LENGTH=565 /DNA_ID=CAMNT_0052029871 /DNA_START=65 /DNA_END=1762 /DNA_ORIENTATION=+